MSDRPAILVIGHARHGKDTVAQMLADRYGYRFSSSSFFCLDKTIWPNWGCAVYDTPEECYADRINHRQLWFQMILAYNTPDGSTLARAMLDEGFDLYVGMRSRHEFEACRARNVFDHVIWVDRSELLGDEPQSSMELTREDADIVIPNNGGMALLTHQIDFIAHEIGLPR